MWACFLDLVDSTVVRSLFGVGVAGVIERGRDREGGERTHLLLALVIRRLTTLLFRDGASFLLLIWTTSNVWALPIPPLPTHGMKNVFRCLVPSLFRLRGTGINREHALHAVLTFFFLFFFSLGHTLVTQYWRHLCFFSRRSAFVIVTAPTTAQRDYI